MLGLLLVIFLIMLIAGAFPTWSYSRDWGYGPSGTVALVLLAVVVLAMMGYLPLGLQTPVTH